MSIEPVTAEENRKRFIDALRTNPKNLKQHFSGGLFNPSNGEVCALGLGCIEFDISLACYYDYDYDYAKMPDPYDNLTEILNLAFNEMSLVWTWNDTDMLTFSQIADRLEELWFAATIAVGEIEEIR